MGADDERVLQRQMTDLVSFPREDMGVDCKRWVDLGSRVERAKLGKDLIALANHGAGFVVFGIGEGLDRQLVHVGKCPYDLKHYSQDAINEIVSAYASPSFQCRVMRVECPHRCGGEHVVIKVPGGHSVPIRCRRGAPDPIREPKKGEVYVRRPKPESAPIQEPHEWDDLFDRCIRSRQDELVEAFIKIVDALEADGPSEMFDHGRRRSATVKEISTRALGEEFRRSSTERFLRLQAEHDLETRYALGVWSVSYAVQPAGSLPMPKLLKHLEKAAGSETGWPPWHIPTREAIRPYDYDNTLECWLAEPNAKSPEDPLAAMLDPKDAAHSDFWRASPAGQLFLARGYQEDGFLERNLGTVLELTITPIWRLAECLLHAQRFALAFGGPAAGVSFDIRWEGLKGRRLTSFTDGDASPQRCLRESVESYGFFPAASIGGRLAEIVQELAAPLYAAFEDSNPALGLYEEEIGRMLGP